MKVGLTLAQRRDDSTDVGPTLDQPALLSGDFNGGLVKKRAIEIGAWMTDYIHIKTVDVNTCPRFSVILCMITSYTSCNRKVFFAIVETGSTW